ncbi:MAG: hypothetical protein JW806_07220 [Sedimentisphaerales bacterium]|nr:hypothetical protein [Sedimentisphaerales bacterium]
MTYNNRIPQIPLKSKIYVAGRGEETKEIKCESSKLSLLLLVSDVESWLLVEGLEYGLFPYLIFASLSFAYLRFPSLGYSCAIAVL